MPRYMLSDELWVKAEKDHASIQLFASQARNLHDSERHPLSDTCRLPLEVYS